MNLFEKLNRLDDSLIESTRVSKKKKLTENYFDEMNKFMDWILEYRHGALWDDFATEFEAEEDPDISVVLTWLENFDEDAYYDYIDTSINEKLTESVDKSKLNIKDRIEEIVLAEFETGHLFADDYESFKSLIREEGLRATPEAYSYYQELHELGPTGFYKEFKDKFEFDSMFIDEYADIDDDIDEVDDTRSDIESVKDFKLYDKVVTETGDEGYIVKFLYTDEDDPIAEIKQDWFDYSPKRFYISQLNHVDNTDDKLDIQEQSTESCNYRVRRYGQWWWAIIGPDNLYMRQDNGKLLLFKSKDKAVAYIDTLCKNTLTEGNNVSSQLPPTIDYFLQDIAQMYGTITYKDIMEHEYTEEDLKKLKNYRRRFIAEIPYEGDEEADKMLKRIANIVAQIVKSENMLESRNNPYFTPYGYKDAAKVLSGKAPEYYYHLKEIEMDSGDGVKLARYAMRKGLPVMVDKNSDPDYLEFAIKGEYHWNDYFYPYPTAHEKDFVAWDGKMFVEEELTSLAEGFLDEKFLNNIDQDILSSLKDAGPELITNNSVKCSKSVVANALYYVDKGEDVEFILGNIDLPMKPITHCWIKHNGEVLQTRVPKADVKLIPKATVMLTPNDIETSKEQIKQLILSI